MCYSLSAELLLSQGSEQCLAQGCSQHKDYYYHQHYYQKLFNHFLLVRNVSYFQFLLYMRLEGTLWGIMLSLNFRAFLEEALHLQVSNMGYNQACVTKCRWGLVTLKVTGARGLLQELRRHAVSPLALRWCLGGPGLPAKHPPPHVSLTSCFPGSFPPSYISEAGFSPLMPLFPPLPFITTPLGE